MKPELVELVSRILEKREQAKHDRNSASCFTETEYGGIITCFGPDNHSIELEAEDLRHIIALVRDYFQGKVDHYQKQLDEL